MFQAVSKILSPQEVKEKLPLSAAMQTVKAERDAAVKAILSGADSRKLFIVGPCSADNETAVLDYVGRLAGIAEQVKDKLLIVPRIYTNKPRTTGDGYKGTVLDEKSKGKNFKIDDSVRRLPPQIYDVEFDAEKKKGDRVSYRVITEVTDKTHVMQPSLSQQINSKTKKLELVLTVPRGLVKNVTSSVYADSAHKVEIGKKKKIDTKTYGEMETYEVCIKNPELLHRYFIGWEWL